MEECLPSQSRTSLYTHARTHAHTHAHIHTEQYIMNEICMSYAHNRYGPPHNCTHRVACSCSVVRCSPVQWLSRTSLKITLESLQRPQTRASSFSSSLYSAADTTLPPSTLGGEGRGEGEGGGEEGRENHMGRESK